MDECSDLLSHHNCVVYTFCCLYCFLFLCYFIFFLMHRQPPRSTRTDTLFPSTTLFRSGFYAALGYAVTPRAVMARWLRLPAEPPPDAALPPDIAVAAGRPMTQRFTITYLEMTDRPAAQPLHPPPGTKYALLRAERPTVAFYRYLYNTVGGAGRWWYRRQISDAGLAGLLADDRVEVFVLHVDGTPAGYFELDRRDQPGGTGGTIDLAYFGPIGKRA